MKTFKLKQLHIVNYESDNYESISIPLLDGLIINREDNENSWLAEAYTKREFLSFFKELKEKYDELIVHVRITTDTNELATCFSSIIGINEIDDNMNILLLGTMVDQRTSKIEKILEKLAKEGHRGEELLKKLKEKISKK